MTTNFFHPIRIRDEHPGSATLVRNSVDYTAVLSVFQADYQADTGAVEPAGRPYQRPPQHIPHLALQAQPAALDGLVIGSDGEPLDIE
jgi:hypothetical protein